jgi:non-specific serine/threonine protein kinase
VYRVLTGHFGLPTRVSSFIGRQREIEEVLRLLGTSRLVTLVGSGGIGKTRLALHVAMLLQDKGPTVALAELAPLADPGLVTQTVAEAVGVRELPGTPINQTLKQGLQLNRTLLLLDNCEHLAQSCAELAEDLLEACPKLQILATSRQPLGVSGEVTWRVPSLSIPDADTADTPEKVLAYGATRLFLERATAARPDFELTPNSAAAIADVCRQLDGIPLALELAARIRLLSVEQLAARLDDRLRLLSIGPRTAPPRQRTLRSTMDWSFALLRFPERLLFTRLSVFSGGWTLDAAEAVCSGGRAT